MEYVGIGYIRSRHSYSKHDYVVSILILYSTYLYIYVSNILIIVNRYDHRLSKKFSDRFFCFSGGSIHTKLHNNTYLQMFVHIFSQ